MAMGPGKVQGRSWKAKPMLPVSLDKVKKGCFWKTLRSVTRQSETDGHKSRSLQLPQNRLGESSEEVHAQVRPFTPAPGAHDTHFLIIKNFRKLKRFIKTKNARANERARQCN